VNGVERDSRLLTFRFRGWARPHLVDDRAAARLAVLIVRPEKRDTTAAPPDSVRIAGIRERVGLWIGGKEWPSPPVERLGQHPSLRRACALRQCESQTQAKRPGRCFT
jgi:hypothetical protein